MANLANALKREISDAVGKETSGIRKELNDIQRTLQPILRLLRAAAPGKPRRQPKRTTAKKGMTAGKSIGRGAKKKPARKAATPVKKTASRSAATRSAAKSAGEKAPAAAVKTEAASASNERKDLRFSPGGLKVHRKSMKLSAGQYGLLVDASALSVYNWEGGKAKPRPGTLAKLSDLKKMGKRAIDQMLEEKQQAKSEKKKRGKSGG